MLCLGQMRVLSESLLTSYEPCLVHNYRESIKDVQITTK